MDAACRPIRYFAIACLSVGLIAGASLPLSARAGSAPPDTTPVPTGPPTSTSTAPVDSVSVPVAPETLDATEPDEPAIATTEPPLDAAESVAPLDGPVETTEPPIAALDDPTYGVAVEAVCVDLAPAVDVASTGTGDIRVTVGPASVDLTAAQPTGRLPWPTVDDGTPDTVAKWDAVRLDTMELVANGELTLPADCPPPPVVPSAPEDLMATPGDTTVSLTWLTPISDGGSPILDYVIEQSPDGITGWTTVDDGDGVGTTATLTGLTNGVLYYFRVAAVNANGSGPPSLDVKVTPLTIPGPPLDLVAEPTNRAGEISLTWAAPSFDGGSEIVDYVIESSSNGTDGWTTIGDGIDVATTYTVTGLIDGTTYYFRILAANAAGTGGASAVAGAASRSTPSAARSLAAAPTNLAGQVRLTWLAPVSDGGSTITDYVIQRSPNGTTGWTTITDGVNVATAYTVIGLANGTRYYFRVYARNAAGTGPASNTANALPRAAPTAPRSLTAVANGASGQISLAWVVPSSNGGSAITDYVIQRSPNGTTGWTTITDGVNVATAYTVTGLANGTRYYFRVYARNAAGTSASSNVPSAVPVNVLTAPRSLIPTPGNGSIRLSWTAPLSNGGSPVTDYVIQRSPNGATGWITIADGTSTATSFTVVALTNGARYYFRVYARTARATSPSSTVVNAIPRTVPSAPRTPTAAPTNLSGQIRLTWLAPASNGGSAITDYVIQRSPNGTTGWTTITDGVNVATAYTVTGLANGTRYYFRIYSRNAAGTSAVSPTVNAIPRTVPSAPRTPTAAPTNLSGQIRLTWLAPASNGGSAITDYVIQRSPNGTTGWTTITDGVNVATAYTVTGLANGTRYYFRVYSRNGVGTSAVSPTVNAIPRTVPSAPRTPAAAPTNLSGQIRLTWLAPASNGGSAITDYIIQRSPNGTTGWTTITDGINVATAYTVTGLANGTRYYFRIYARNAAGTSAVSPTVNHIPRTVPGQPDFLYAEAFFEGFYVEWDPPTSTGGSPVTGYVLEMFDYDAAVWFDLLAVGPTVFSVFIDSPGEGCGTFRVSAVNAAGRGPFLGPVEICFFLPPE